MTATRYHWRISGPLLDRIGIHVEVPRVEYERLSDERLGEAAEAIRQRVEGARERQQRRIKGSSLQTGADMGPAEVRTCCLLDDGGRFFLRAAMQRPEGTRMTARVDHRIPKLPRTIVDLAGSERIGTVRLAEAILYRPRRKF